jgi:ATP-binding cassette, subfamily C (CFTR/MRP), member 1
MWRQGSAGDAARARSRSLSRSDGLENGRSELGIDETSAWWSTHGSALGGDTVLVDASEEQPPPASTVRRISGGKTKRAQPAADRGAAVWGLFAYLTVGWISPLVRSVYSADATDTEVRVENARARAPALPTALGAERVRAEVFEAWGQRDAGEHQQTVSVRQFVSLLGRLYGRHIVLLWLLKMVEVACSALPAMLSAYLLNMAQGRDGSAGGRELPAGGESLDSNPEIVKLSLALGLSIFTAASIANHTELITQRLAIRVSAAVMSLLFHKLLRLDLKHCESDSGDKTDAAEDTADGNPPVISSGHIANVISSDVTRIYELLEPVRDIWSAPLRIILAIWIVASVLDTVSALSVLVPMMAFVPVSQFLMKKEDETTRKLNALRDSRMTFVTEIIRAARLVKLFGWEHQAEQMVSGIRQRELEQLSVRALCDSGQDQIWSGAPLICSALALSLFVARGNNLSAGAVVAVMVAMTNCSGALWAIPAALTQVIEARRSCRRICDFLSAPEAPAVRLIDQAAPAHDAANGSVVAEFRDAVFSWGGDRDASDSFQLSLRDMSVDRGSLLMIAGRVGAGKSSLLSSLLSELGESRSTVATTPKQLGLRCVYASQDVWLTHGTMIDNITEFVDASTSTLSSTVIREHAVEAVRASQMTRDLVDLPGGRGGETVIGDRGVQLSGGQKARLSLARCVFSALCNTSEGQHTVALLDDPLSAVDPLVAGRLFHDCIVEVLVKRCHCTVVLVSHQAQFLPFAAKVLCLEGGEVVASGPFKELQQRQADVLTRCGVSSVKDASSQSESVPLSRSDRSIAHVNVAEVVFPTSQPDALSNDSGVGVSDSVRASKDAYVAYFFATGSARRWILVSLFGVALILAETAKDAWITSFADGSGSSVSWFLSVYVLVTLLVVAGGFVGSILANRLGVKTAASIHERCLEATLGARLCVSDTTPGGVYVKYFSHDTTTVDRHLVWNWKEMIFTILRLVQCIAVPALLAPLIFSVGCMLPMMVVCAAIFRRFEAANSTLSGLESRGEELLHASFSETLGGLTTIRAFQHSYATARAFEIQWRAFSQLSDEHALWWMAQSGVHAWQGVRLALVRGIFCGFASFFCAASLSLSAGQMALTLMYVFAFDDVLGFVLWLLSRTDTNMASMARACVLSSQPQEPSVVGEGSRLGPHDEFVLRDASVEFENVTMRYLPPAAYMPGSAFVVPDERPSLQGVSFRLPSGTKLGVCGRTGAGKSSLIAALFRLVELESGRISIGGDDISKIPLHLLRGSLSIIPQDPALFTGTARSNLDPFSRCSDASLLEVLEKLPALSRALGADSLDATVTEGGGNYSAGQRQLFCLARVLVERTLRDDRQSGILVLDEATSAVDGETDDELQRVLAAEFGHCTVITIAHRLQTLLPSAQSPGSDLILVLDHGRVAEIDEPTKLLRDSESTFSSMMRAASLESQPAEAGRLVLSSSGR